MTRTNPHRALRRALVQRYPGLVIESGTAEPWVSATFAGARHVLLCNRQDVTGIEDAELQLPSHFVADIAWRRVGEGIRIEALTIEAA